MKFFTKYGLLRLAAISDVPKGNKLKGFSFHWVGDLRALLPIPLLPSQKPEIANMSWKLYSTLAALPLIHCMCLSSFSCKKVNSRGTAHIPTVYLLLSKTKWPPTNYPSGMAAGLCQLLDHARQWSGRMTLGLSKK